MSDLSDTILKQVILELKEHLDGPAKERFTKLPPSHQREWARYISSWRCSRRLAAGWLLLHAARKPVHPQAHAAAGGADEIHAAARGAAARQKADAHLLPVSARFLPRRHGAQL